MIPSQKAFCTKSHFWEGGTKIPLIFFLYLSLQVRIVVTAYKVMDITGLVSILLCILAFSLNDLVPQSLNASVSSTKVSAGILVHYLYLYNPSPSAGHSLPSVSTCTEHFSGAGFVPCISILFRVTLFVTDPHGVLNTTLHVWLELAIITKKLSPVTPAYAYDPDLDHYTKFQNLFCLPILSTDL